MSIIISLGIIVFAMLIVASLQLVPGVFLLFYHHALGRFSKAKASDFALFFMLGVETISVFLFLSLYYLICIFFFDGVNTNNLILNWIIIGIMLALSLASIFFYYRRGKGTKLFLPRTYATVLNSDAKMVKNRSDAFLLGAFSGTFELIFTLPLYLLSSIEIIKIESYGFPANLLAILFVFAPLIPLLASYSYFATNFNLADLIKNRFKVKPFIRFILSFSYFMIAILIFYLKVAK